MEVKKRSGISAARSHKLEKIFRERMSSIFSQGIRFQHTHEHMLKCIHSEILDTPEWKMVPERVRSYIEGYWKAKRDEVYQYHLVWVMSVDGKLMTNKEIIDALTEEEKMYEVTDKTGQYRSPWSRVNSNLSRHVWKDRDGKILLDKPYDARFLSV